MKRNFPFLFLCILGIISYLLLVLFTQTASRQINITYYPRESMHHFAKRLEKAHVFSFPEMLVALTVLRDDQHHLQAGQYHIASSTNRWGLINAMVQGQIIHRQLVVIPGDSYYDLMAQIPVAMLTKKVRLQLQNNLLMPDTYRFTNQQSLNLVLALARQRLHDQLLQLWQNRQPGLLYRSPSQALIMASILEKEASNYQIQQHIAQVFLMRLRKHMYLDANATVRFAVHQPKGMPLNKKDFLSKNVYNTYRHKGLPPTPIAYPSMQAIKAALHPLKTHDLYYHSTSHGKYVFH